MAGFMHFTMMFRFKSKVSFAGMQPEHSEAERRYSTKTYPY